LFGWFHFLPIQRTSQEYQYYWYKLVSTIQLAHSTRANPQRDTTPLHRGNPALHHAASQKEPLRYNKAATRSPALHHSHIPQHDPMPLQREPPTPHHAASQREPTMTSPTPPARPPAQMMQGQAPGTPGCKSHSLDARRKSTSRPTAKSYKQKVTVSPRDTRTVTPPGIHPHRTPNQEHKHDHKVQQSVNHTRQS
jgi:hypothetical protein